MVPKLDSPALPIQELLAFLKTTPSPYHVSHQIHAQLKAHAFTPLNPSQEWNLLPGQKYFIQRGGSTVAFILPSSKKSIAHAPLYVWASHSDSPALKLKSLETFSKEGQLILFSEPYGGLLQESWLNRDLHIAGRIFIATTDPQKKYHEKLIWLKDLPLTIPAPAIHFRSATQQEKSPNTDIELRVLLGPDPNPASNTPPLSTSHFLSLLAKHADVQPSDILGSDLAFVSAEPPQRLGQDHAYLASSRLDNLAMTHAGLFAFLKITPSSQHPVIPVLTVFNHEEIGSRSSEGAASHWFLHIIEQLSASLGISRGTMLKNFTNSFIISADMAHATHPNFPHLHSESSRPLLGHGPVLKKNGNLRYISEGDGEAFIRHLAKLAKLPLQTFTGRSDLPSGSTIGPLLASHTTIPTIDLGTPMLSMHSIRELMACQDHIHAIHLARAFWSS